MPRLVGLDIHLRDSNPRASAVVGIVGLGGIGISLQGAIDTFKRPEVSMVLLTILARVVFREMVSSYLRKKIH